MGSGPQGGSAFFGFGTNAAQVQQEIEAALARIQAAFGQVRTAQGPGGAGGRPLSDLGIDTKAVNALGKEFVQLRLQIQSVYETYNAARAQMKAGLIPQQQLTRPMLEAERLLKARLPQLAQQAQRAIGPIGDPATRQNLINLILEQGVQQVVQQSALGGRTRRGPTVALQDIAQGNINQRTASAFLGDYNQTEIARQQQQRLESKDPYFTLRQQQRQVAEGAAESRRQLREAVAEQKRLGAAMTRDVEQQTYRLLRVGSQGPNPSVFMRGRLAEVTEPGQRTEFFALQGQGARLLVTDRARDEAAAALNRKRAQEASQLQKVLDEQRKITIEVARQTQLANLREQQARGTAIFGARDRYAEDERQRLFSIERGQARLLLPSRLSDQEDLFKAQRSIDQARQRASDAQRAEALSRVRERALSGTGGLREQEAAGQAVFAGRYARDQTGALFEINGLEARRLHTAEEVRRAQAAITAELGAQARELIRTASQAGPTGPAQAFFGGLTSRGFSNRARSGPSSLNEALTGVAATAGTVAKYSLLYQALGLVQQGVSQLVAQDKDYQDSLADLQVAMSKTGDVSNAFVDNLSELARLSGSNVGEAMDSSARGIRAFGDAASAAGQSTEVVGEQTAKAATMLSVIAEKDLKDATGDVIAIGSAYKLTADQLGLVVDAIASAKRNFGGSPNEISQGLANIGTTAAQAGYSVGQAANIIAATISRVDESGQAAATRLSRIFATVGGSTGQSLQKSFGLDTTGKTIRDQIRQIAEFYVRPTTTEQQRGLIRSQIGGTSSLRELSTLVDPDLAKKIDKGLQPGAGVDEFTLKLNNLVSILKQVTGDLKALAVDLARSDLFYPLGAGLKVLEGGLHTLDELLKAFNNLTSVLGPMRGLVTATVELGIALRVLRGVGIGPGGLLDVVAPRRLSPQQIATQATGTVVPGTVSAATASRVAAAETAVNDAALRVAAAEEKLAAAAEAQVAGINTASRARNAAESRFVAELELLNEELAAAIKAQAAARAKLIAADERQAAEIAGTTPLGARGRPNFSNLISSGLNIALLAGAVAIVATNYARARSDINTRRDEAARLAAQTGNDPLSLQNTVDALNSKAEEAKKAASGFTGLITTPQRNATADAIKDLAKFYDAQRLLVQKEQALAAQTHSLSLFGDAASRTVNDLNSGLRTLAQRGTDTRESISLLLNALINPQVGQQASLMPSTFVASLLNRMVADIPGAIPKQDRTRLSAGGIFGDPTLEVIPDKDWEQTGAEVSRHFVDQSRKSLDKVQQAMRAELAGFHLKPGEVLTPQQEKQIVDAGVNAFNIHGVQGDADKVRDNLRKTLLGQLRDLEQASLTSGRPPGLTSTELFFTGAQVDPLTGKKANANDPNAQPWTPLVQLFQNQLQNEPPRDLMSDQKLRDLQTQLTKTKDEIAHPSPGTDTGDTSQLLDLQHQIEDEIADTLVQRDEELKNHLLAFTVDSRKRRRIEFRLDLKEVDDSGADTVRLLDVLNNMDESMYEAVTKAEKQRLEALKKYRLDHPLEAAHYGIEDPSGQISALDAAMALANPGSGKNNSGTKLTPQQMAAYQLRRDTDPADQVGQANVTLQEALADFDALDRKYKKNTKEYQDALTRISDAEKALAEAKRQSTYTLAQIAAVRTGDPLKAAIAEFNSAIDASQAHPDDLQAQLRAAQATRTLHEQRLARQNAQHSVEVFGAAQGDPLQIASGALDNAEAEMKFDPWSPEKRLAFLEAQKNLRDMFLERVNEEALLAADIAGQGDPLAQAKATLDNANRELAANPWDPNKKKAVVDAQRDYAHQQNQRTDDQATLAALQASGGDPLTEAETALANAKRDAALDKWDPNKQAAVVRAQREVDQLTLDRANGYRSLAAAQSHDELTQAQTAYENALAAAKKDPWDPQKAQAVVQAQDEVARQAGNRAQLYAQLSTSLNVGGAIADADNAIHLGQIAKKYAVTVNDAIQAQLQINQGIMQKRQAELDYAATLDQLSGDITDPVENARDALKDARRRKAYDRRHGASADTLKKDDLAIRQDENQLEAAKFQQRLSDAQTNYELGRSSFGAYMKYLDSEHDRLTKIKHKNRQQQDELNDIDRAIKGLNDQMQGQFNLGDIKLPTVYQARRAAGGDGAMVPKVHVVATSTVHMGLTKHASKVFQKAEEPTTTVHTTRSRK